MLPNEELLMVLRRQINFDTNQKATAIDCLATCALKGVGRATKLRGLSPHANYTDRAAAAGRRS